MFAEHEEGTGLYASCPTCHVKGWKRERRKKHNSVELLLTIFYYVRLLVHVSCSAWDWIRSTTCC